MDITEYLIQVIIGVLGVLIFLFSILYLSFKNSKR